MSTIYNGWRKWDFENRNHDKLYDQNDERVTFNHDVLFLPLHWIGEIRGWQDFTVTRPSWFIKDLTVRDAEALKIEAFLGLAIRMARDIAFLSLARTARIAPRLIFTSPLQLYSIADIYVGSLRAFLSFVPPPDSTWTTRGFFRGVNCTRDHLQTRERSCTCACARSRTQRGGRAASLCFFAGRGASRPSVDPARGASREITFSIFLSPRANEQAQTVSLVSFSQPAP